MNKSLEKQGFKWVGLSVLSQYILQVTSFLIIARIVGPESIGIVTACLFFINIVKIFVELGFPQSLIQNESVELEQRDSAILFMFIIALILMVIIYSLSKYSALLLDNQSVTYILPVLSFLLPIGAITLPYLSWLQRQMRYKNIAIINIVSSIVAFPVIGVTLATLGFGVWSLICSYIGFALFNLLGSVYANKDNLFSYNRVRISSLLAFKEFSLHFTSARFANFVALEVDNLIVGWKFGVISLGFYSRAYQLMTLPATLIGTIGDKVLFPLFSRERDDRIIEDSLTRKLDIISACTIPFTFLVVLNSNEFVLFLLGKEWSDVSPILEILSFALFFRVATKFIDATVRALGYIKQRAMRQYFYALVVIVTVSTASLFTLEAVAFAVMLSIIINFFIMFTFLASKLSIDKRYLYINILIKFINSALSLYVTKHTLVFLNLNLDYLLLSLTINTILFLVLYLLLSSFIKYLTRFFNVRISK